MGAVILNRTSSGVPGKLSFGVEPFVANTATCPPVYVESEISVTVVPFIEIAITPGMDWETPSVFVVPWPVITELKVQLASTV
jgi:hypothetical protein